MMRYQAFRRLPSRPTKGPRKIESKNFPAPTKGWVASENIALASPLTAFRMDNWFPEKTGCRLRGGSSRHATIGENPVETLFSYRSGGVGVFFASDATSIFDITTPADPEVAPTASVTGQTSGYYSVPQFTTSGGTFIYALNGTDAALLFDGTTWYPVTDKQIYGLAYDAETVAFTAGETVTGGTSSATAEIVRVIDNGLTGTLWVRGITGGPFQDNETITDGDGGSATANIPSGVTDVLTITITNVDSSELSQGWIYRDRLFFVKQGTMDVFYPAVGALGGALENITLQGIYRRGGSVLFGATWSLDSGAGIDDKCVIVSTEGEAAVFEGSNPSGTTTAEWNLVGVYDCAKPLGKNAWMRVGGDLLILTEEGVVPLTAIIKKDPAALALSAVSRPIEPEWRRQALLRKARPWEMIKWTEKNMGIINVPVVAGSDDPYSYVVNLESGAWARYTGWDTRCIHVFDGNGYFGTNDGRVMLMESGGTDDDEPYECVLINHFDPFGAPGFYKQVQQIRASFIANRDFMPLLSASVDYAEQLPAPPESIEDFTLDVWDVGLWDVAVWDSGDARAPVTRWDSVGRSGFTVAWQVQVTCATTLALVAELRAVDLTFEVGDLVV